MSSVRFVSIDGFEQDVVGDIFAHTSTSLHDLLERNNARIPGKPHSREDGHFELYVESFGGYVVVPKKLKMHKLTVTSEKHLENDKLIHEDTCFAKFFHRIRSSTTIQQSTEEKVKELHDPEKDERTLGINNSLIAGVKKVLRLSSKYKNVSADTLLSSHNKTKPPISDKFSPILKVEGQSTPLNSFYVPLFLRESPILSFHNSSNSFAYKVIVRNKNKTSEYIVNQHADEQVLGFKDGGSSAGAATTTTTTSKSATVSQFQPQRSAKQSNSSAAASTNQASLTVEIIPTYNLNFIAAQDVYIALMQSTGFQHASTPKQNNLKSGDTVYLVDLESKNPSDHEIGNMLSHYGIQQPKIRYVLDTYKLLLEEVDDNKLTAQSPKSPVTTSIEDGAEQPLKIEIMVSCSQDTTLRQLRSALQRKLATSDIVIVSTQTALPSCHEHDMDKTLSQLGVKDFEVIRFKRQVEDVSATSQRSPFSPFAVRSEESLAGTFRSVKAAPPTKPKSATTATTTTTITTSSSLLSAGAPTTARPVSPRGTGTRIEQYIIPIDADGGTLLQTCSEDDKPGLWDESNKTTLNLFFVNEEYYKECTGRGYTCTLDQHSYQENKIDHEKSYEEPKVSSIGSRALFDFN